MRGSSPGARVSTNEPAVPPENLRRSLKDKEQGSKMSALD